jgi:hypothetical protein
MKFTPQHRQKFANFNISFNKLDGLLIGLSILYSLRPIAKISFRRSKSLTSSSKLS